MRHYQAHFRGKVIFCNCDDPYESNFFKYFALNFNFLGLKKLIATGYNGSPVAGEQLSLFDVVGLGDVASPDNRSAAAKPAYKIEITEVADENKDGAIDLADVEYLLRNRRNTLTLLEGDGDFRSAECIRLLQEADIVATNPPFSLFREYVVQLVEHKKKFLILGSQNAITYKEVFRLIKDNVLWLGVDNGGTKWFRVPDHYEIKTESRKKYENGIKYFSMGSVYWFTNLDHSKRHESITLYQQYTPQRTRATSTTTPSKYRKRPTSPTTTTAKWACPSPSSTAITRSSLRLSGRACSLENRCRNSRPKEAMWREG